MTLTSTLEAPRPLAQPDVDPTLLARLFSGRTATRREMHALMTRLINGELSDPVIAALLLALRLRHETAEELIGAAFALREACKPFARPEYLFADSCGTGGDSAGTINISTATAFVAAAAGLPVVKHGNRSFTSQCGSADVLERLGVKIDAAPETMRAALDQTGVCFLFAPLYHVGVRHAGPARKALGVRTMMNVLGPCLNPAAPGVQLLGVAEPKLLEPVAKTLIALGVERALVVHGAGLDEIALHGPTHAVAIEAGGFVHRVIAPEDAGLRQQPVEVLRGGDPEANAARLSALLAGRGRDADNDAVALNAGALLHTAGKAASLSEGVAAAQDALRAGAAGRVLAAFVDASRG